MISPKSVSYPDLLEEGGGFFGHRGRRHGAVFSLRRAAGVAAQISLRTAFLLPEQLVDEMLVLVGLVVGGFLQGQGLVHGAPSLQSPGDLGPDAEQLLYVGNLLALGLWGHHRL